MLSDNRVLFQLYTHFCFFFKLPLNKFTKAFQHLLKMHMLNFLFKRFFCSTKLIKCAICLKEYKGCLRLTNLRINRIIIKLHNN